MLEQIKSTVKKIKQQKPLIVNVTNYVTMEFIANGLLSLGASPVMTNAKAEIEELIKIADCLVINIGTLNEEFISLCHAACEYANKFSKPIIFDPVGAGATNYRTQMALDLLNQHDISIVRGNAGEVMGLAGNSGFTRGVEVIDLNSPVEEYAKILMKEFKLTVVVSGEEDLIVSKDFFKKYAYGSSLMPKITGMGCLLTAVIAAFHAVEKNSAIAASLAVVYYGLCGEAAAKKAQAPGTFREKFLNEIYLL